MQTDCSFQERLTADYMIKWSERWSAQNLTTLTGCTSPVSFLHLLPPVLLPISLPLTSPSFSLPSPSFLSSGVTVSAKLSRSLCKGGSSEEGEPEEKEGLLYSDRQWTLISKWNFHSGFSPSLVNAMLHVYKRQKLFSKKLKGICPTTPLKKEN